MIRRAQINDLNRINELGLLLDNAFTTKNELNKYLDSDIYILNVLEIDNLIQGFILATHLYENIEILYLIVDKDYQKCGYGKELLNSIITNNDHILLEVRNSNENAISFYHHLGFNTINIRKNYYDNGDDALIMERSI
ncbi:MAG: GNAT family N-acetyltransferase [Bacilli bacterium]|nr:GNAT family N-acetyltransferase [Bacilli bacterium]